MVTALALLIKANAKRLETNDLVDMAAKSVGFVEIYLLAIGRQGKSRCCRALVGYKPPRFWQHGREISWQVMKLGWGLGTRTVPVKEVER